MMPAPPPKHSYYSTTPPQSSLPAPAPDLVGNVNKSQDDLNRVNDITLMGNCNLSFLLLVEGKTEKGDWQILVCQCPKWQGVGNEGEAGE